MRARLCHTWSEWSKIGKKTGISTTKVAPACSNPDSLPPRSNHSTRRQHAPRFHEPRSSPCSTTVPQACTRRYMGNLHDLASSIQHDAPPRMSSHSRTTPWTMLRQQLRSNGPAETSYGSSSWCFRRAKRARTAPSLFVSPDIAKLHKCRPCCTCWWPLVGGGFR